VGPSRAYIAGLPAQGARAHVHRLHVRSLSPMEPLWDPYEIPMGPLWYPYGTPMGPLWDPYGTPYDPYGTPPDPYGTPHGTPRGPTFL